MSLLTVDGYPYAQGDVYFWAAQVNPDHACAATARGSYAFRTWPARFGVDVVGGFNASAGYFYAELPTVKLLLLRHEDASRRAALLGSLGYRFEDRAYNTHGKSEKEAKGSGELGLRAWMGLHFKLPEAELRRIYAERELAAVYTAAEREAFIAKYRE